MRKLLLILIVLFLFPVVAFSTPFLACDIPTETIAASEVEIDGNILQGIMQISADGMSMLLFDLAGFAPGRHNLRARFQDASGWWSDWSSPLDAGKPGTPGNVSIKEN